MGFFIRATVVKRIISQPQMAWVRLTGASGRLKIPGDTVCQRWGVAGEQLALTVERDVPTRAPVLGAHRCAPFGLTPSPSKCGDSLYGSSPPTVRGGRLPRLDGREARKEFAG